MSQLHVIYFFVPYGDWFVGFSEMPFSLALLWTAAGVRPSLSPMTRVGVFSFAICRSSFTSELVHCLPVLRVDLLMTFSFRCYGFQ